MPETPIEYVFNCRSGVLQNVVVEQNKTQAARLHRSSLLRWTNARRGRNADSEPEDLFPFPVFQDSRRCTPRSRTTGADWPSCRSEFPENASADRGRRNALPDTGSSSNPVEIADAAFGPQPRRALDNVATGRL